MILMADAALLLEASNPAVSPMRLSKQMSIQGFMDVEHPGTGRKDGS